MDTIIFCANDDSYSSFRQAWEQATLRIHFDNQVFDRGVYRYQFGVLHGSSTQHMNQEDGFAAAVTKNEDGYHSLRSIYVVFGSDSKRYNLVYTLVHGGAVDYSWFDWSWDVFP